MSKYNWRLKSFAKGIDPDAAVEELERIENIYGSLTAENILRESEQEGAILHPLFEWNNDAAAIKYRLQQARLILNNVTVSIIQDGATREISVYEVVNIGESRTYKNVETMSPMDVDQVRKATINELNRIKDKLSFYKNFDTAISHISNAVNSI